MLSGWGRYPRLPCEVIRATAIDTIPATVLGAHSLIARGNGRSYGDAALNLRGTLLMGANDRLLAFDPDTGRLACEAGVLLSEIISLFVPRGWFPPVTPGTKFVTIGGMIAADVHGKNHHGAGSFGQHVESLDLAIADGRVLTCSPTQNSELFRATIGGMGLTGVVLAATFRLMPIDTAWIRQDTLRAPDLDAVMEGFEASKDWTYTVAWIDCLASSGSLGRSLLYRGEHAGLDDLSPGRRDAPLTVPLRRPRQVPVDFPSCALNRWSVSAFNALYYRRGRPGSQIIDYDRFFYPLDAVLDWNRIYGRAGFVQYQCVLPKESSREGLRQLLGRVGKSGIGSFLAVLKLFGRQGDGMMSFPLKGYTLALDFPATAAAFVLMIELDAIVRDHGGRLYLAKDSRAGAALFRTGYPALPLFQSIRAAVDPHGKFSSVQSERLAL